MSLKVLSPLALVTGSTPSTPQAGYGTIFASGSSVYFQNSSGVVTDLAGARAEYRYFTSSGTWTRPATITGIQVIGISGGGGGGSGRVGSTGVFRYGGAGGAAGSLVKAYFTASILTPGNYSVTIGTGGVGGASQTVSDSNGFSGTTGSFTSFTSSSTTLVFAPGGAAGAAGSSSLPPSTPGRVLSLFTPRGPNIVAGSGGENRPAVTLVFNNGLSGGGSGGTISSSNALQNPSTSQVFDGFGSFQTYSPNTVSGSLGIDGLSNAIRLTTSDETLLLLDNIVRGFGIGGMGSPAGSGANSSLPSAKGGDGGDYGGGGAGSGGATNGASSGAGGNGGDGILIIIEYY